MKFIKLIFKTDPQIYQIRSNCQIFEDKFTGVGNFWPVFHQECILCFKPAVQLVVLFLIYQMLAIEGGRTFLGYILHPFGEFWEHKMLQPVCFST